MSLTLNPSIDIWQTSQQVNNFWQLTGSPTCVIAYDPWQAADYDSSLVNLANPGTYNAVTVTQPGWDNTNGWDFQTASSTVLNTTFEPPSNANTYTLAMYCNGPRSADTWRYMCGVRNTRAFGLRYKGDGWFYHPLSSSDEADGTHYVGGSTYTWKVYATAGNKAYWNGSAVATLTAQDVTDYAGRKLAIGCTRTTSYNAYATFYCRRLAIYSETLTPDQMSELYTKMTTP